MNVLEISGVEAVDVGSAFDRKLHGVDVRQDLGGARADAAPGLLLHLGSGKRPGIDLHPLDLRRLRWT
jgi:hypothetical protein